MQFLLGLDLGSSSVKGSLLDVNTGLCILSAQFPQVEMSIDAPQPGWAEQDPENWWIQAKRVIAKLAEDSDGGLVGKVAAIGISYQMHGLVCLDKNGDVLRPSIIWCDSRAVSIGDDALNELGSEYCLGHLLNSPGNFTASKLAWVKRNEPDVFRQIDKICLPGDYLAFKLSGSLNTTKTGLSEGVFFDFKEESLASRLLEYYQIEEDIIPETVEVFSIQSQVSTSISKELNISEGVPIAYRAGDQPNNALSLGVLDPGQIAATAGTSGVVYGVSSIAKSDSYSRVNTFLHVNHKADNPRYGVLMCVNGCGIQNRWMRDNFESMSYDQMNKEAALAEIGSSGLKLFPYGNGAERTLSNKNLGSSWHGLDFNQHSRKHLLRASQEGIVFAMMHGVNIMKDLGVETQTIRAGNANMFLSPLFCEAFTNLTGGTLEIMDTDGSLGAARGAGIGCGVYKDSEEAFRTLQPVRIYEADSNLEEAYQEAYLSWKVKLDDLMSSP